EGVRVRRAGLVVRHVVHEDVELNDNVVVAGREDVAVADIAEVEGDRRPVTAAAVNVAAGKQSRGRHSRAASRDVQAGETVNGRVGRSQVRAAGADERHAGIAAQEAQAGGQGVLDLEC